MMKRVLSCIMALVMAVTAAAFCGITVSAKDADIKVRGYSGGDGMYYVELYGLTRKQYTSLLNDGDEFYVSIDNNENSAFISVSCSSELSATTAVSLIGYNGYNGISAGAFYNNYEGYIIASYNASLQIESIYGTADDKSYGFRWSLDTNDEDAKAAVADLTASGDITVFFSAKKSGSDISIDGLNRSYSLKVSWNSKTAGGSSSNTGDDSWKEYTKWSYDIDYDNNNRKITISKNIVEKGYTTIQFWYPKNDVSLMKSITNAKASGFLNYNVEINSKFGFIATVYSNGKAYYRTYDIENNYNNITEDYKEDLTSTSDGGGVWAWSFKNNSDVAKVLRENTLTVSLCYFCSSLNTNSEQSSVDYAGSSKYAFVFTHTTDNDIIRPTLDISLLDFTDISDKNYTGKAIKPSVTIKEGTKTLVKGVDYTVKYKNNKKIGKATITVTGKGDYKGTKTITFNILPKKPTLSAKKSGTGKVTLSWTKSSGAAKYEIYCSTSNGSYKKVATVSAKKLSKVISGLSGKLSSYQFKIRAVATGSDGKTYYTWSNSVSAV